MALPKLETPTYELVLPSTNKKIKYRPFLVKEHKILLTLTEAEDSEVSRILRDLIEVCTFNKLNAHQLPHFDVEYIFMMLRAKSVGEKVDVIVNCECGNKIDTSFNIEDIKVEKPNNHQSKIMLTQDIGIEMKYPNIDDVISIYGNKKDLKILELVRNSIQGIFSKEEYWEADTQSKEDLEEFLNSLTKEQFEKIENFFTTSPKVIQTIEADCNQCGKHNIVKMEGLQNFFV